MTREDIIAMAREAGIHVFPEFEAAFERFAALIATHEREACAKVCEGIYYDPKENDGYDAYYTRPYLECAAAIRARSNT